jgi:hypothetical protein
MISRIRCMLLTLYLEGPKQRCSKWNGGWIGYSRDGWRRWVWRMVNSFDKLLPLIDDINDSVQVSKALSDWFDDASTDLGQIYVVWTFTTCQSSPDRMVNQYCIEPITFGKKLIGTTDNITDDTMKTRILKMLPNSYQQTVQILQ